MEQDYLKIQQRVRHYWFKDGIGEIAVGGLFIALSMYFAGHQMFSPASKAPVYLNLGLFVFLIVGVMFTRKLINVFKERITYPRTGYVEYYLEGNYTLPVQIILWALGFLFVITLIAIGRWIGSFQWLPAFLGVLFGAAIIFFRVKTSGLKRFSYHAALSVLLGGILSLIRGISPQLGLSWYYAIFGTWLVIWGIGVLAKYLRENPQPEGG